MNEIKCPKCGTVFQISETDYESIVKQIRDKEFDKEINLREEQYKTDKENSIKLAELHIKEELTDILNKKELEISQLKNELKVKEETTKNKLETEYINKINKMMLEISELKNKIELQESNSKLEIQKAISEKDKKIDSLNSEIEIKDR